MASLFDPPQQQNGANATNCILASAIHHLPFVPLARASKLNLETAAQSLQKLHTSLLLHCVRVMDTVANNNPFLHSLLSVPAHFRNFCQVHCRKTRISNTLSSHSFAAILPGDSVAGLVVANGLSNFLNIYNTLLVVRLVLTWFPNSPPAIVSPLSTICDPYLNIFRGLIPPLGGLDLSPILAFLVLNAFTSTAAALPAELPPPQEVLSSSNPKTLNLTTMQKKWLRRVQTARSKNSSDVY